jgi:hypothetical protein
LSSRGQRRTSRRYRSRSRHLRPRHRPPRRNPPPRGLTSHETLTRPPGRRAEAGCRTGPGRGRQAGHVPRRTRRLHAVTGNGPEAGCRGNIRGNTFRRSSALSALSRTGAVEVPAPYCDLLPTRWRASSPRRHLGASGRWRRAATSWSLRRQATVQVAGRACSAPRTSCSASNAWRWAGQLRARMHVAHVSPEVHWRTAGRRLANMASACAGGFRAR